LEPFTPRDLLTAGRVERRGFGGLTRERAAEDLGISPPTADRAGLSDALVGDGPGENEPGLTASGRPRRMEG